MTSDLRVSFPSIGISNEEETEKLGKILAAFVFGGLFVSLTGALGAGKTALVRAIGAALGTNGVKSPTFATENIYALPEKNFKLVHADLYRFDFVPPGSETSLQLEEHLANGELLLAEWGERWETSGSGVWRVNIFQADERESPNENYRRLDFSAAGEKAAESLSLAYGAIMDAVIAGEISCR
jgi:tRNA threonylcarbamoyl adenosine modification protein YjeE